MRSALRASALALVLASVVAPGCRSKEKVGLAIAVPRDLISSTTWFEVGAFKDATCGSLTPMLQNGVPDGSSTRVAFRRDAAEAPTVGDLDVGSYAFGAVAKGDDCSVLAFGCTEVTLGKTDTVSINLATNDVPTGACGAGASCQAARCVPANDNADPSVGSQCSLELLGAGPLANPVGGGGTLVSAPAIATTPAGFVIAYREIDPNGSSARLTIIPVDPAGGALDPTRPLLKGRCANSDETDGIGLLMNGTDGKVVLARSACGAQPGLEVLSFTSTPLVTIDPHFVTSDSSTATKLTLSGGHVTATRQGGSVVAFTEDGLTRLSTVDPTRGVVAPTGTFGASSGATGAWATASDKVLAVLSAGPSAPAPPTVDAGDDAGDEAGAGGGGGGDDTGPTLSLVMTAPTTPADQFSAANGTPSPPITFPGMWGAVGSLGKRVIVMSDGGGPGRSITYRAFDLGKTTPAETNGFSIEGAGTPTTGDIALLGDRVYFAALKPGSVSVHVFGNASTVPTFLRESIFPKEPRIPSVANVRDGRVAIAATESRVAVAWTTAKVLDNNDSTGGYAVFACTP